MKFICGTREKREPKPDEAQGKARVDVACCGNGGAAPSRNKPLGHKRSIYTLAAQHHVQ